MLLSSFLIAVGFSFHCRWLYLLLPLASANGLQTVQRLLALASFSSITKHLKNVAKAKNTCLT
jgi:hypothetical protein